MKVFSEPLHLFTLMHETIATQPHWETDLAPRILLGLWHPRFIPYAQNILPYCKRSFIGVSLPIARAYFWDDCEVFSVHFAVLASWEGQRCALRGRVRGRAHGCGLCRFIADCKNAGKKVMVWTVNEPEQMIEVSMVTNMKASVRPCVRGPRGSRFRADNLPGCQEEATRE